MVEHLHYRNDKLSSQTTMDILSFSPNIFHYKMGMLYKRVVVEKKNWTLKCIGFWADQNHKWRIYTQFDSSSKSSVIKNVYGKMDNILH